MADLATRPRLLAVIVHLRGRECRQCRTIALAQRRTGRPAQDVHHHRPAVAASGRPQRQVENRTQVLLELTGRRAVNGPVAGVVRTHRQLIDEQPVIRRLEQLHREYTGDAETLCDGAGDRLRNVSELACRLRRWRDHLCADTVALHALHHGPRHQLTRRAASNRLGQLAAEVDQLLRQQRPGLEPVGHLAA